MISRPLWRPPGTQENTCPGCGYGRIGKVCLRCAKCWTCGTKIEGSPVMRPAKCANPMCPDVIKRGGQT